MVQGPAALPPGHYEARKRLARPAGEAGPDGPEPTEVPMRRLSCTAVALTAIFVACSPADEPEPEVDAAVPERPEVRADQALGPVDRPIRIRLVADTIQVDPDSAEVRRGARVGWASPDQPDAVWVVAFPDSTPFQNGRAVFHGGGNPGDAQGPIPPKGGGPELPDVGYKYWVFFADSNGQYRVKDPKLVVVDEPTADTVTSPTGTGG